METYKPYTDKEKVRVALGLGAFFGFCLGMGLAGEAGKVATARADREATARARQAPLETTCQELSKMDKSVKIDGVTYTLNCDQYGTPVLQERGE